MWHKLFIAIGVVVFAFPVAALICWPIVKVEKFVKPRVRSWFKPIIDAFDEFSVIIMYGWWDWRDDRAKKRRLKEIERQKEVAEDQEYCRQRSKEELDDECREEAMMRSTISGG